MIYDYSTLTGPNPLQYVMFNKANYDEAAVLVYDLAETVNASATTVTDYQYALWNLMNPNVSLAPGRASQEQALQTTALAMVNDAVDAKFLSSTVYAYTEIYTPTSAYAGNQEFIEYSTPEPNMALPLGLLALAAGVGMKVRRKSQRVKL
jgi:methionine synthase II (cobalamin-independent)